VESTPGPKQTWHICCIEATVCGNFFYQSKGLDFKYPMNKSLYQDEYKNAIRISNLKKFEGEIPFAGFAAKFVVAGQETYHIRGKKYQVEKGEYILGNSGTMASIEINGKEDTKGLCVDVAKNIIAEVSEFHFIHARDISEFLLSDQFLVNKYNAKNTNLGYALNEISSQISRGTLHNKLLNLELFYSIAESIVTDQQMIYEQYSRLDFKKPETRESLFRKLLQSREYIDEHLTGEINLDLIAREAFISKYHFIRLFKSTFSLSPYQYVLRKKLEIGKAKLKQGASVQDTAYDLGYPDIPSFSKAFKAAFGVTPSAVRLK
jgi:AraC family transcriptional regulator